MLSVNNIEVTYNSVILVLRGVSFQVKPGQVVALLGANGAGKSTTLKAISGLLSSELGEVTRGTITWSDERITAMKLNDHVVVGGYAIRLDSFGQRPGENFREVTAHFAISKDGQSIGVMDPSKRSFITRSSMTTEAALLARGFSQLYISLGDPNADGSMAVRIYHKPLVLLIWIGTVVMVFGGGLSLMDRRLRVGAPTPAKSAKAMQPAE